jgi:exodeoxyribonuclease V alpha subunit
VAVVGKLLGANVGATFRFWGRWTSHASYGKQFEIDRFEEKLPATIAGIRKYLGSGLIKGIGPKTAERIVERFGLETLDVIETAPEKLAEVPGVGAFRANSITAAWVEQRQIKTLMVFLQSHDITTGLAVRIYKAYGDAAADIVRTDPYRLAREVWGVGFRTADRIARNLGLAGDSPARLEAGVLFALSEAADDGHTYLPRPLLVETTAMLLAVDDAAVEAAPIEAAIERLVLAQAVIVEDVPGETDDEPSPSPSPESTPIVPGMPHQAVYLPVFHYAEVGIANRLRRIMDAPEDRLAAYRSIDWQAALDWIDKQLPHPLAARQREAVRAAFTHKVAVLTGGPGTGKTTTVRSILQMLGVRGASVRLAAPTGRAAKRLAETTGTTAKTLHRLLEFKPTGGEMFARNEANPLDADMIVVDEMSMVDTLLMNHLTKAVDPSSHLLLVGDVDQLPSVGAGHVLRDLIACGAIPTVVLDQIFRQDEKSYIAVNAHRINQGQMPIFDKEAADFFQFRVETAEDAADRVVDVVTTRIPKRFGLDPLSDIQVLTPMHRGAAGVAALNERLQAALNPSAPGKGEVRWGGRAFRTGDKVMQVRNNYDKDVFNGDIGRVIGVDAVEQTIAVDVEGTPIEYAFSELDELTHAFACSTHKSQGAEYPCVVLALVKGHYMLLQRNLLYPAVTRARRLCVLVADDAAIRRAVGNDRVARRWTGLGRRLGDGDRRVIGSKARGS